MLLLTFVVLNAIVGRIGGLIAARTKFSTYISFTIACIAMIAADTTFGAALAIILMGDPIVKALSGVFWVYPAIFIAMFPGVVVFWTVATGLDRSILERGRDETKQRQPTTQILTDVRNLRIDNRPPGSGCRPNHSGWPKTMPASLNTYKFFRGTHAIFISLRLPFASPTYKLTP
jgi:hypothetical protein